MKKFLKLAAAMLITVAVVCTTGCKKSSDNNDNNNSGGGTVTPTCPTGAIDGLFSVSANKQVYFSQGNLQYQASTNTWRFAENQWDYVGTQTPDNFGHCGGTVDGSDNRNISSDYSGWIDLFGWGTSGLNHGAVCYHPYDTSTVNSNYWAYGSPDYNLNSLSGTADWGYNAISNGGNTIKTWRTLTGDEWLYVFDTRITTSGIRYAKAQVNGINGVILLPDDWNSITYNLNNTNIYNASFNSNVISLPDWNVLESSNAVFLPAAGNRYGNYVRYVGSVGSYYSSTKLDGYSSSTFEVLFGNSNLVANVLGLCRFGNSVRLVQDYQ